ncbi:Panacea domain-containing protein [Methanolapillus millepedarum]|uniref:Antitoxin SocA-like Panacea domain-containing protein n=1 Tax=Methanolapillus millepedarum TaxID=3028296 RepID=A0AA96V4W9_9EURY|nr:hypothetical protein MsAc7_06070 [Methanosarcinaceae archaeon Ac7]
MSENIQLASGKMPSESGNFQFDILDVADWFLNKCPIQHKRLQKLCYYAVAWHYALLDTPLCKRDEFQAWVHGPVNPIIYAKYKNYVWTPIPQLFEKKNFQESEEVFERV